MGKGAVEDEAFYEVCSECRVVCQTTHGKDLPHAVPSFFKTIVEHSTPSSTNCHLQIPAPFIRNHIGLNKKEMYVLVGAQGCEWVMTFNTIGFKAGWKEFSVAYQLETGDAIMLSLVAPKRFYAHVFDKFGIEKFDTNQPRNRMASPTSKEYQVSNSMNGGGAGGAGNQYTPFDSNGTHLHREGKSNGIHHHTAGTSGQNGSHDNNRILFRDKNHLFPNEPVDHEADPSSMSLSSGDSEDSIQVRLAKAVLAKARQKKLKRKMKANCTSTPKAEDGITIQREEGTIVGFEACQNDDRADGRSNVDPTDSPLKNDETPASVDDAMFENPCEELRGLTDIRASLIVGGGLDASNVEEVNKLQAVSQPVKLLQEEESPLHKTATMENVPLRGAESNNPAENQPIPLRGAESNYPAEDHPIPLRGAESTNPAEGQPIPLFIPGLVKQEPDLSPHQTSENCNHCGKRKELPKFDRSTTPKSEPVTTDSPGVDIRTLEARSPSSYAHRVTEFQKQLALSIATELSKTIKNPNALVVGRVSMSDPHGCFLSNMCSEMLPSVPTELTLMDTEGNAQRVNWKPNQRIMDGPGWKDFVVSHNLHADDFWVMEVVNSSENDIIVKAHIFRSHEMERSLERQPPAVRAAPVPTVPVRITPAVPAAPLALLPVLGTPAPVLGTVGKTRSSNQLHNSVASPSKTNKRTRAPNVDEGSPIHCATNTTEDDHQALLELTRPSPMKRPRRGLSSSPATPRRGTDSTPISGTGEEEQNRAAGKPAKPAKKVKPQAARRHSLYSPHGRRKVKPDAVVATTKRGGGSQSASKAQLRSSSTTAAAANERAESPKQVRTRNSQKTHYKVSKVIDRRKSLQGVVFLVELTDRVRPESLQQKRMKAQQDEKGRWWVPHHHFNHNLSACYLE